MTETATMVEALRILSSDIQSGDGVANACVSDAADMIESMSTQLEKANERIEELEDEVLELHNYCNDEQEIIDALTKG